MKKLYFFAAMTSVLFCACSNNDEPVDPAPASAELTFTSVNAMEAITRASFSEPFHLYMPAEPVASYPTVIDSKVEFIGEKWTIETGDVYLNPADRNLYAWAPETVTPKSGETTVFELTSGVSAVDFIFKKASVSSANHDVSLVLAHAYAQVEVKLDAENYSGAKNIDALSLEDAAAAGTIDISKDTDPVSVEGALGAVALLSAPVVYAAPLTALVVPMTTAPKVKCTLDGVTYGPLSLPTITKLESGYKYTITLQIKGTQAAITEVTAAEWGTGKADNVELTTPAA